MLVRTSILIEKELLEKAKNRRLNISEICREALHNKLLDISINIDLLLARKNKLLATLKELEHREKEISARKKEVLNELDNIEHVLNRLEREDYNTSQDKVVINGVVMERIL